MQTSTHHPPPNLDAHYHPPPCPPQTYIQHHLRCKYVWHTYIPHHYTADEAHTHTQTRTRTTCSTRTHEYAHAPPEHHVCCFHTRRSCQGRGLSLLLCGRTTAARRRSRGANLHAAAAADMEGRPRGSFEQVGHLCFPLLGQHHPLVFNSAFCVAPCPACTMRCAGARGRH